MTERRKALVSFTLSWELLRRIDIYAKHAQVDRSTLIRTALDCYLDRLVVVPDVDPFEGVEWESSDDLSEDPD